MSQSVARADHLIRLGRINDAIALLRQAAESGDAQAAAFLGELRLSGQIIRRDLREARAWFGRAAALGLASSEPIFIALLANGAGGTERRWAEALRRLRESGARDPWALQQASLLADMAITDEGDPLSRPSRATLFAEPLVETIAGFLSPAECRYLIARAEPFMQPAEVVDPRSGQLMRDPVRKASSASFPFVVEDPVLHAVNRRIAAATGTTYEQGEPLQVLRYDPGDEYKPHSDALPPGNNQRTTTFLVALNDSYDGGETEFPRLNFRWRGKPGDALCFANVDGTGAPEPLAWHAGTPVRRGTKFLLSKWIRQDPLDLSGPPGRPL
ncbi:2OG-Fe(II) oxygenase [Novosphingobium sp. 9U]|uniref:2OG-Fe(II) oxygenase n=1 Tax=Novosphingobium sp. 9U TaxID=2653158 RepID=UPI0012F283D4|nr:2OG-Fe(II) oxygenase [Novosphingobium sp. 9U]VWX46979.1 putative eukaryotic Peptidyl prolyl 4-hydroxylase, alpha subunit [Novosphingobium sp. 9U]